MNDDLTTREQREHLMETERKARKEVARSAQTLQELTIEYVPLDSIKPNPWNPNRQSDHDFELLCRSIEEDGFTQPVVACVVTEEDMETPRIRDCGYLAPGDTMIVDGEHRWRARHKLGFEDVPIARTPMNATQAMIATLRHNRARGSEDFELAAEVLRDLQQLGSIDWAMDSLMLDQVELDRILEDVSAPDALAGEDYGEGWVPEKGKSGDHADLGTQANDVTGRGGDTWRNAGTQAAIDAQREREKRLAEAKTEEQREAIRRDTARDFFRLSLIFEGEEGKIVKDTLGSSPAEALIFLCRQEAGELQAKIEGDGWILLEQVTGSRAIPAEAARVISEALDQMEMSGDIGDKNRWQGLEYMAAEFVAGQPVKLTQDPDLKEG